MSSLISSSSFRTAEDTESVGDVSCRRGGGILSDMIDNFLVCCCPGVQGEKPHNDCFFAIDCSSPHAAYPNTIEVRTYTSANTTSDCIGQIQKQPEENGNHGNEKEDPLKRTISPPLLQENAKEVSDTLTKLSPITVNSKASEQTKNGATKTTAEDSRHRRANDSRQYELFHSSDFEGDSYLSYQKCWWSCRIKRSSRPANFRWE